MSSERRATSEGSHPRATVQEALLRGHTRVTLPVCLIMAAGPTLGWLASGWLGALIGLVLGPCFAWPWWSFAIPKWRDWVEDHGIRPEEIQGPAEAVGLVWSAGSFFERTEFRRRDGRRGW